MGNDHNTGTQLPITSLKLCIQFIYFVLRENKLKFTNELKKSVFFIVESALTKNRDYTIFAAVVSEEES